MCFKIVVFIKTFSFKLNYAKLNYNINNCQGNLGNFIDSIFIKKENVFIIHSYCEGQKDTLKVGSFW